MPALSSAAHLHFLAKSQKIIRDINTQFCFFYILHENIWIPASCRPSEKQLGRCGRGLQQSMVVPSEGEPPLSRSRHGEDVTGRVLATNFYSFCKCVKQQRNSFTVFGKCNEVSIRWWPFLLWYLILESQKSLLFVNRPLSCRQKDTYAAKKH